MLRSRKQWVLLLTTMLGLSGCSHPRADDSWDAQRLIQALGNSEDEVRSNAAKLLGEKKAHEAFWPLVKALGDERWEVRANAAESLGLLRDPRAVKPLVHALADPHWWTRIKVVQSLGILGDRKAIEPLKHVTVGDNNSLKEAVSDALRNLGSRGT